MVSWNQLRLWQFPLIEKLELIKKLELAPEKLLEE